MDVTQQPAATDVARLIEDIYRDGIVGLPNILPVGWVDRLDEDLGQQFLLALRVDKGEGVAFRGWSRYYVELYPERLRGFTELVTNPVVVALNRQMLGDDYEIVELGADIPLPGAPEQPPHRDFPMPEPTRLHRRLTSPCTGGRSTAAVCGPSPSWAWCPEKIGPTPGRRWRSFRATSRPP